MDSTLSKDEDWLLKEKYQGQKTPEFYSDCDRMQNGEPLAYLIGHVPFLGCTIYLDSHPLIPRPETEFWVEKAIAAINATPQHPPLNNPLYILDLCAGSGCIGVAVGKADHLGHTEVHFAEYEQVHFETIHKNMEENGIDNTRIPVFIGDLFTPLAAGPNAGCTYDFILSNPPYIDPHVDRAEPSVKAFEPHLALYGGVDGMELITRIIKEAPAFLKPHGQLWLEHEPEQAAQIASLSTSNGFTVVTHPDQYEVLRYSVLVLQ